MGVCLCIACVRCVDSFFLAFSCVQISSQVVESEWAEYNGRNAAKTAKEAVDSKEAETKRLSSDEMRAASRLTAAQAAMQVYEDEVEALERKLAEASSQRDAARETLHSAAEELDAAKTLVQKAQADVAALRRDAMVAQERAFSARQQLEEDRKLYNPLNHPMIKGFLGK